MKPQGKVLFHEKQRMRDSGIWWLFLSMSVITLGLLAVLGLREAVPKEELAIAAAIFIPAYAAAFYLMYTSMLETEVREDGVYYRWAPFFRKPFFISKESIAQAEERKSPWMQYGFHLFPTYGKVHNVSGRQGIQFYLTNGRKIYIGTQELYRFRKALETITPKPK